MYIHSAFSVDSCGFEGGCPARHQSRLAANGCLPTCFSNEEDADTKQDVNIYVNITVVDIGFSEIFRFCHFRWSSKFLLTSETTPVKSRAKMNQMI